MPENENQIKENAEQPATIECDQSVEIPLCCGEQMKIGNHIGPFVVAKCNKCGDTIYVKCGSTKKPQMISD